MDMFDDVLAYETCFPSTITGQTTLDCTRRQHPPKMLDTVENATLK